MSDQDRGDASSLIAPPGSPIVQIFNPLEGTSKGTQTLKRPPKITKKRSFSNPDINNFPEMSIPKKKVNAVDVPNTKQLLLFVKEARDRKIFYYGEQSQDAMKFLQRIEDLRNLITISDPSMVKILSELLKGTARAWFNNHVLEFTSYEEFRQEFIEHFVPCNYEAQIRLSICSRKQEPEESVTMFISEIRGMNNKLNRPFSELELIETLKLNLNSKYLVHVHLTEFCTLNQLEKFCSRIEKAQQLYSPCHSKIDAFDKSQARCYDCKKLGHFAKECPDKKDNLAQAVVDLTNMVKELKVQVDDLQKQKN